MQQLQPWDQVQVTEGSFEGKAGVVRAFDKETGDTIVKLDTEDSPIQISSDSLKRLG